MSPELTAVNGVCRKFVSKVCPRRAESAPSARNAEFGVPGRLKQSLGSKVLRSATTLQGGGTTPMRRWQTGVHFSHECR